MSVPAVSVVIPTLNEAPELPATLDSVEAALGGVAEIVVCDGGSTDDTARAAASRARVVRSAAGRGRQLNSGARAAHADVLLFLHADTWLSPGAGSALAAAVQQPQVVGGCFRLRLRGPSAERRIAKLLAAGIDLRSQWLRTATGDQAIWARRAAFQRIGGFAEDHPFEDVLFYRRLRRLGRVVVLEPAVQTSERRWRERGYARTIGLHLGLRLALGLGIPPNRLGRFYRSVR